MYEEEYAAFIRVKILKMTGKRGGTEPLTFGDLTIRKTGFVHLQAEFMLIPGSISHKKKTKKKKAESVCDRSRS